MTSEPAQPRAAIVLGASPGARRGSDEWRPYGDWEPAEVAEEMWVPTVEVWLAPDPDVKAWLAAADAAAEVDLRVNEAGPGQLDAVILTFATPGQGELDLLVPAALVDVVARAALLTGDPLVITATTTSGPLEPRWWAQRARHEPDLTFVADAGSVRRAVLWQLGQAGPPGGPTA
jgi:hypothetical protein